MWSTRSSAASGSPAHEGDTAWVTGRWSWAGSSNGPGRPRTAAPDPPSSSWPRSWDRASVGRPQRRPGRHAARASSQLDQRYDERDAGSMLAFRSVQQGNHGVCEEFLYELKAGRGRPPAAAVLAPAATRRSPGSWPHRLGELGAVAARWKHRRSYLRRSRRSQSLRLSEAAPALSLLARSTPMKGELA